MFQEFPYTDMHQLNLDWIIKIAKDFLDQYTHIQQLISEGEQSLQDLTSDGLNQLQEKADNLQELLDAWYEEHSADIADQLADALQDLNEWYTEHQDYLSETLQTNIQLFDNHADQKAAETIATIPSDYTTLSNTVLDNTAALGDSRNVFNPVVSSDRIRKYFAGSGWVDNNGYNVGADFYLLPGEHIYFWKATNNGVVEYAPRFMFTGPTTDALTNDASGDHEYLNWLTDPQYVRFTISILDWDSVMIT